MRYMFSSPDTGFPKCEIQKSRSKFLQIPQFSESASGVYGSKKEQLHEIIQGPDVVHLKPYIYSMHHPKSRSI